MRKIPLEKIEINIDVEALMAAIEKAEFDVKRLEQTADKTIEKVKTKTKLSYMQVVAMARTAYTIGLGIVKAAGVSVSYFFRAMISAAFGAISVLAPIISAEAVTPGMQIQAALGAAELAVAIMAVMQAQRTEMEIARELRGVAMSLGGLQSLLNMIPDW